jgi:tRNA 2-thiouridine synthesizing protein A
MDTELQCWRILASCQNVKTVSNTMQVAVELDTQGLQCPMPLLKTKLALRELLVGQVLKVTSSDAGSARDIPRFIQLSSHVLHQSDEVDGCFIFMIEKGA